MAESFSVVEVDQPSVAQRDRGLPAAGRGFLPFGASGGDPGQNVELSVVQPMAHAPILESTRGSALLVTLDCKGGRCGGDVNSGVLANLAGP